MNSEHPESQDVAGLSSDPASRLQSAPQVDNVSTAEPASAHHVPVMLERIVEVLAPCLQAPNSVVVDATLGLGGHAYELLRNNPQARLIGLDRDPHALARSRARLAEFADRSDFVHAVYDELPQVLAQRGVRRVDAILFDLGVSSMQLDLAERGFAYAQDAPLDMRMDPTAGLTAADVLNTYAEADLARILSGYGEERFARRIAAEIVRTRQKQPFTTSAALVALLREAIPMRSQRTGGHPAKRTFQALRIEVNAELSVLERAIPAGIAALSMNGRIAVLSYHSLEDRIVKRAFAAGATSSAPQGLPVELPEHRPYLRLVTRGAEVASDEEIEANSRASSVRLRVAERIGERAA